MGHLVNEYKGCPKSSIALFDNARPKFCQNFIKKKDVFFCIFLSFLLGIEHFLKMTDCDQLQKYSIREQKKRPFFGHFFVNFSFLQCQTGKKSCFFIFLLHEENANKCSKMLWGRQKTLLSQNFSPKLDDFWCIDYWSSILTRWGHELHAKMNEMHRFKGMKIKSSFDARKNPFAWGCSACMKE